MPAIIARLGYYLSAPLLAALHASGVCAGPLALRGLDRLRWRVGRWGAWIRFQSAVRDVPAYREFLRQRGSIDGRSVLRLAEVPATDKLCYVKAFPLAARCVGGRLPERGVVIDESSGSSGVPTNWVRGPRERASNQRAIRAGLRHRLGDGPFLFINAFALGPWATGMNITMALSSWSRVKSLGPDVAKIENALRQFGPDHHYVILGYPPFLKQLVDRARIDWPRYRVTMIFGGEAMSESMRRYLQGRGIRRVYGSYGASDLELNIAAETDLTIALRRLLEAQPAIAARVLRHAGAMPMIFQYNPAEFFIETNADGELLVTVCRPGHLTPKIRYNIHDVGHVVRVADLARLLAGHGVALGNLDPRALDLPLLFHYGRADLSVAFYGCKIAPADVQESLFRLPALATSVESFQLHTFEDAEGDKRLVVSLEVPGGALPGGAAQWTRSVFDSLADINQDFRESRRMVTPGKEPSLEVHDVGIGPFEGSDIRIKRTYVRPEVASS